MFGVCLPFTDNEFYQDQWDYVLLNFKPDEIYIIGAEEESPWLTHKVMRNAKLIKSYDELPYDKIVLAPVNGNNVKGEINLKYFKHPEDSVYIFGPDHSFMVEIDDAKTVYIENYSDDQMFSWVAAAVTFYDRRVKNG